MRAAHADTIASKDRTHEQQMEQHGDELRAQHEAAVAALRAAHVDALAAKDGLHSKVGLSRGRRASY